MNSNPNQPAVLDIGEADFEAQVLRAAQPVLVVFWAPWSRPCHVLESTLHEVAAACAGTARVITLNADNNPELSMWYDVQSVPTSLFFSAGRLRAKLVGTVTKEAMLARLQAVAGTANPTTPDPSSR